MECNKCHKSFNVEVNPGALIFSPPEETSDGRQICEKIHICQECWIPLWKLIIKTKKEVRAK